MKDKENGNTTHKQEAVWMEIERNEEKKIISVWLTKAESQDQDLQHRLKAMYPKWKQEKYLVAVYHSGTEDLFESTLALLAYNKKRCAELAIQREKNQPSQMQVQ